MNQRGISGSTLKILAVISMLIDHTAAILLEPLHPYYTLCRNLGRLAFPIFCFLLVEGYVHTRDVKKYGLRLFIFAIISEIPFDLAFSGSIVGMHYQNVFFTLLLGLCVLYFLDRCQEPVLRVLVLIFGMAAATLLRTDYSWKGIAAIVVLYVMRRDRLQQSIIGAVAFSWEPPAMLAFLPIYFYNGKRGISMKYLFYVFYPAHLLLLVCIKQLLPSEFITWFAF
ncbi:MAG: TraX family protein [Acetivibrio ethanolgignens]